jgi:hypothetical protein
MGRGWQTGIGANRVMSRGFLPRYVALLLTVVAAYAAFGLIVLAGPAWAVEEHAFDPVLSLTGDTTVSADDGVPDPGSSHPGRFNGPCGVAVDRHGDVYVVSAAGGPDNTGTAGRIDVFDQQGHYLTQVKDERQPCAMAVDSKGNLYVYENGSQAIVLFAAESFPPHSGSAYAPPVTIASGASDGVAVDPSNDHVYVAMGDHAAEYDSADNGSALLDETIGRSSLDGRGPVADVVGIDVCAASHDIYLTSSPRNPYEPLVPRIYILSGEAGHSLKAVIDGSTTPDGSFGFSFGRGGVAVDQTNCDVYVSDVEGSHQSVDQFDSSGGYIGRLQHNFKPAYVYNDVAVDGPAPGEEGYDSPNTGYVYATSGSTANNSHLYAFRPGGAGPPEVSEQVASQVSEAEAVLRGRVNPNGLPTTYHFEYVDQSSFEESGYAGAIEVPAPEADAGEGSAFLPVSAMVDGLAPGVSYRFRLVATNQECTVVGETDAGKECEEEGRDASFSTYTVPPASQRGYELVTPPNTEGRIPTAALYGDLGQGFAATLASADGTSLAFGVEGGSLPGLGGGGFHDTYVASRGPAGWQSRFAGLPGEFAAKPHAGGISADHGFSFWSVLGSSGSFLGYLRGPGGIEPIGLGSLGEDIHAQGRWISSGAGHIIFVTGLGLGASSVQLEPNAPPAGVRAIYDRTPGGPTRVVSLLPGNLTPTTDAEYLGCSTDGSAVAFAVGGTLYLRIDNTETIEVASGGATFAGLSSNGERAFYLQGGDIFSFDVATKTSTQVGAGGESTVVNISADGSHVYFVSPQQLDEAKESTLGKDNLYVWSGGAPDFVAKLKPVDVIGEEFGPSGGFIGGLGLWLSQAQAPSQDRFTGPANDPSRTNPDGSVLVFESRANLTPAYESHGKTEIYRYDDGQGLTCISCNPTGAAAESDARLQSRVAPELSPFPPVNAISSIDNVTDDGRRVFFQSDEALVAGDVDGRTDVYEWRSDGSVGCQSKAGCLSLISSGHSSAADFLYAMSANGDDVFFETGDILTPQDSSSTPSIYDARVGGGFPVTASARPCQDACQGERGFAPTLPVPAVSGAGTSHGRGCGKGKRVVRRKGKPHCAKKHPPQRHPKQPGRKTR